MRLIGRTSWLLGLATLSLACGAFADTVTFTLTGVSGGSMAGVYTSPYLAAISSMPGVTILAICDDYATHSYIGQQFEAAVTNVASLQDEATASQDVKFDRTDPVKQQKDYVTASYLAQQLLAVDQSTSAGLTKAGELSFAIWGLFYEPAFDTLGAGSTEYNAARQYLTDAQTATANRKPIDFANVDIYTPTQATAQEFIVVRTDEPESAILLGVHILAVLSLVFFFRKRLIRAA